MKVILAVFFSLSLFATELQNEVIYGVDNRSNLENFSNVDFLGKSFSVAVMIQKNVIEEAFGGVLTKINVRTLENDYSVCKDEPGSKNFTVGKCTGFLIAPDLLATAGHCINSDFHCKEFKWIFDFREDLILKGGKENELFVSSRNVYECQEIVHREYDYITKLDFALIRLDRPALDRPVLKLRTKGKIENDAELVMIGHPLGQAMKVTMEGKILDNSNPIFFKGNLDSFMGNSGSPIFNKKTGLVEGILVRGEGDFVTDEKNNCDRIRFCPENGEGCQGEDITRITQIPELKDIFPDASQSPSEESEQQNWNCFFSTINC